MNENIEDDRDDEAVTPSPVFHGLLDYLYLSLEGSAWRTQILSQLRVVSSFDWSPKPGQAQATNSEPTHKPLNTPSSRRRDLALPAKITLPSHLVSYPDSQFSPAASQISSPNDEIPDNSHVTFPSGQIPPLNDLVFVPSDSIPIDDHTALSNSRLPSPISQLHSYRLEEEITSRGSNRGYGPQLRLA